MPATRHITHAEKKWIINHYPDSATDQDVAEHLNVHLHTARRILSKLNLIDSCSDKYNYRSPNNDFVRKRRKCLICKQEKSMAKNQYICARCRNKQREKGLL